MLDAELLREACAVHGVAVLAKDDATALLQKLLYLKATVPEASTEPLDEATWCKGEIKRLALKCEAVGEEELQRRWAVIAKMTLKKDDTPMQRSAYDSLSAAEKATFTVVLQTTSNVYLRKTHSKLVASVDKDESGRPADTDSAPRISKTVALSSCTEQDNAGYERGEVDQREMVARAAEKRLAGGINDKDPDTNGDGDKHGKMPRLA